MTKILLHLGAILLVFSLNSQNLNMAEHQAVDKTGGLVSINSKQYYLKTSENNCCSSRLSIMRADDSLFNLRTQNFGGFPIEMLGNLIVSQDKALVFNGYSRKSCDVMQTVEYVVKLDTNGTILFQTNLPGGSSYLPTIRGLTQHPDGSYYLSNSSSLYHCSAGGQLLSTSNSGLTGITALQCLSNGNLLFNGDLSGIRKNVIVSQSLSILKQQQTSASITKYLEAGSGILAKTSDGVIEKYDTNLVIQQSSTLALSPASYTICDFTTRNDSVFVTGLHGSLKNPFYAILNANLNLIYQVQSNYEGVLPTGIALNNNQVNVISTCNSKPYTNYSFSGYHKFDLAGSIFASQDIGVVNYSVTNAVLFESNFTFPKTEMDVVVKNYGLDTVKNFMVNYYAYISDISQCYSLLHRSFQVSIPPGATVSVPTGTFYAQPYKTGSGNPALITGKWNVCIFTSVPNGQNDMNINNDAFCDTVVFLPTGIKELTEDKTSVTVYPNPFSNSFHLNSEKEIQNIEIYNSTGAIVLQEVVAGRDFELGENWQPGVYFLKCHTNEGVLIRKLVKY